jgi:hypothetical protein
MDSKLCNADYGLGSFSFNTDFSQKPWGTIFKRFLDEQPFEQVVRVTRRYHAAPESRHRRSIVRPGRR